ncbi:kinase-like domain-containing protein [Nemania sp. NC0429]|nr:kinase-like domain-containing protein [Nemania sp. NC0429]
MDNIDDPDNIILYLLPPIGRGLHDIANAQRTINRDKNKSFQVKKSPIKSKEDEEIDGDDQIVGDDKVDKVKRKAPFCLAVRFSDARTSHGVVCGTGLNADLTIPDSFMSISSHHIAFTFDERNRPIARDLGSISGTEVTYDGEARDRRSDFDWPLLGPSITKGKLPVLNIGDAIKFQVFIPPRNLESQDYIERVKKFRLGTAQPGDLFSALNIQSTQNTRLQTGQESPTKSRDPIMFTKFLGGGSFGTVEYHCNLTIGVEYVIKQPLEKHRKSGRYDERNWRQEAKIMEGLDHPNIVKLRCSDFSSHPKLELEYVPEGNLDEHSDYSPLECTQVLCQLSSALKYLHSRRIAHRDIKPENILVVKRAGGIMVKFADFGLSKESDILRTACGTEAWMAPEVLEKFGNQPWGAKIDYTIAVDIWSLGQVVAWMQCGCQLPSYSGNQGKWADSVRTGFASHASGQKSELVRFVIDHMMVDIPEHRWSADACYNRAIKLLEQLTSASNIESSPKTLNPQISGEQQSHKDPKEYGLGSSFIANLGWRNDSMIDGLVVSTGNETSSPSDATTKPITKEQMLSATDLPRGNKAENESDTHYDFESNPVAQQHSHPGPIRSHSNNRPLEAGGAELPSIKFLDEVELIVGGMVFDQSAHHALQDNQFNEVETMGMWAGASPSYEEQELAQKRKHSGDGGSLGRAIEEWLMENTDMGNEGWREAKRTKKED